jgi:DNA-binding CsgD family transcriptional regulator
MRPGVMANLNGRAPARSAGAWPGRSCQPCRGSFPGPAPDEIALNRLMPASVSWSIALRHEVRGCQPALMRATLIGMRLLERESSLASLAAYAREAQGGDGRLVLVAGEAGVGKSALLEQFERDLPDARWSWGACDGLFTPRPLGPLFDIADRLGGDLLDLCQARAARDELFGALLRHVAEPGTLDVVVVEDVHWADEATVDLLRFLGRRIRNAAVLLVVSYRDEDLTATDPLRAALGELARQQPARRVELAPLSADAVRHLAGNSGLDAAELYRLTGGNPFYVTEVLQAGLSEVPAAARDAVLARAARLSSGARDVLDVAALTGARSDLRLVEAVTACAPPAVDEVLASGLLAGDGLWLRFRHEIARLAVERAMAAHRHRVIHARILAALEESGSDDDAQLAFHAEGAVDGPAVLRYATAAAHRAAELASHREAAAQFERALRYAAGTAPETAAGLCDGLADEAGLLDRWQDAADAGERGVELWRQAGDRLREGATLRQLSRSMWRLCRGSEAAAAAEAAMAILEPLGPSAELAWAAASLASTRMLDGDDDAAIMLARQAQVLAESLSVPGALSDALNTEACAVGNRGGDWAAPMHRALDVAIAAGLQTQAGRAYSNLHASYCGERQFSEADGVFAAGIAYCDEHDVGTYGICLRGGRTFALEQLGRWEELESLSEELLMRSGASPVNRIVPLCSLGMVRARQGAAGRWECLDEAMAHAAGSGDPQFLVSARLARAEAYWLEGQPDSARREAELADDVCALCDSWDRGAVAAWLRRTGSSRPPRSDLAEPGRLQAAGDWEQAARRWTGLGCPYEAGLVLYDAPDEAPLREALKIFTELGASAAVQVTRQKMRLLGIRSIPAGPRAATRAHPLGLTRRECEVLELICAGHTNAEIAAKLFISTKTVDHHVSAVLAKLDAPTRDIAAAHAARLGLVGAATR